VGGSLRERRALLVLEQRETTARAVKVDPYLGVLELHDDLLREPIVVGAQIDAGGDEEDAFGVLVLLAVLLDRVHRNHNRVDHVEATAAATTDV
tara:strand:+ start:1003 stop:1284 length:282 start_codon:yes stop_codon:yes gene_type:complete